MGMVTQVTGLRAVELKGISIEEVNCGDDSGNLSGELG
jgi:hypothetical protein